MSYFSNLNLVSGGVNPMLGLYPGSENRFDGLFAQESAAAQELSAGSPGILPGANLEAENTDLGNEGVMSMHAALSMGTGGISGQAMQNYLNDSNASLFDTDMTSLDSLARNARYADQIGGM